MKSDLNKPLSIQELRQHFLSTVPFFHDVIITPDHELLIQLDLSALQQHHIINIRATIEEDIINLFNQATIPENRIRSYQITTPTTNHLELNEGLDSIDKLELLLSLEKKHGVTLSEEILVSNRRETIEKLARNKAETLSQENRNKEATSEKEKTKYFLPWLLQRLVNILVKLLIRLLFRYKVTGQENIPNAPYILAANHQSYLDAVCITAGLSGKQMKESYFLAKAKQFKNRLLTFLRRKNNILVVNINLNLKETMGKINNLLSQGKSLIIFPEGTRTMTGKIGPFRHTFAKLAVAHQIPIVPIAISGAFEAMPRTRKWPKFRMPIEVQFLPPVYPQTGENGEMLSARIHDILDKQLSETAIHEDEKSC